VSPANVRRRLLGEGFEWNAELDSLLQDWHVQQYGETVGFEYRVDGTRSDIAQRLGRLAAIWIESYRKGVRNDQVILARKTVGAIAEQMRVSNAKLEALPAVPQSMDLVRGKAYESTVMDWRAWKSIGFSLTEPQRYQYRVEIAKDGKSGRVIAEGDLDGNGKHSRIWIDLRLDSKRKMLDYDPVVQQQDPFE
jgi:hypothetical protein